MILNNKLDFTTFISLIDNIYDEIFIWNKEQQIIYVNKACYRHYGLKSKDFIGGKLKDFTVDKQLWTPTCVPKTFDKKKGIIQLQKTILGQNIVTISVPVFDENHNVQYIVQSTREENSSLFKELELVKSDIEVLEPDSLMYKSEKMEQLAKYIRKIAPTKASILILGETGTGKTYLAKYIHKHSKRKDKPFVTVNMASLNSSIIESEFFGYQAGAFTGANKSGKKGILEEANGGTLFLDEIGEFPYELQAKFLHVLQEEEFTPVGGTKSIKIDIRIICATNRNLKQLVDAKLFRMDLYHRINILEMTVPPLRDRKRDLRALAFHFLKKCNEKYSTDINFSDEVLEIFEQYLWPGNIRELLNVVERGVILAEEGLMTPKNLPDSFFSADHTYVEDNIQYFFGNLSYKEIMESYEEKVIQKAYKYYSSSRKLAKALKISQSSASRLIKKYIY